MRHAHIHVTGIVQGVGMRPFVYREAMAHGICGWVLNAGDGVHIEAHALSESLDEFVDALSEHAPAASRVEHVEVVDLAPGDWDAANEQGFRIVASQDQTAHTTLISPDIATCDDCLRELFDPADRRYHYPFINCTNCGPRFTIIRSLPYDRAATSMDRFPTCPTCAAEYADPLDRRFHAQPDACFDCGPHITWREANRGVAPAGVDATPAVGSTREASDAIIERCVELLAGGGIVAIKGLGGFHLACDASNEQAVRELRRRKRRSNKPLAVMVRGLADAERLCHIDGVERDLLAGSVRPIVLLRRRATGSDTHGSPDDPELAPSVAHDLPELGVMLPYTPLQHLLLAAAAAHGMHAIVLTSGNLSEEPIETDDALHGSTLLPPSSPMRCSVTTARFCRATTTPWYAWSTATSCSCVAHADMRRNRCRCRRSTTPRPAYSPVGRSKKPRSHSRARTPTAMWPVLCRSISAMSKTAQLSMLGAPHARVWKTSLTWRLPLGMRHASQLSVEPMGARTGTGAQSAAYRSPAPSCAHRERNGRGDCRRPACARCTRPRHRLRRHGCRHRWHHMGRRVSYRPSRRF